jgi:hypothetical protein
LLPGMSPPQAASATTSASALQSATILWNNVKPDLPQKPCPMISRIAA